MTLTGARHTLKFLAQKHLPVRTIKPFNLMVVTPMHRPGGAAQEIRFYKARTMASGPFKKPAGKIDQIAAAQLPIFLNHCLQWNALAMTIDNGLICIKVF